MEGEEGWLQAAAPNICFQSAAVAQCDTETEQRRWGGGGPDTAQSTVCSLQQEKVILPS